MVARSALDVPDQWRADDLSSRHSTGQPCIQTTEQQRSWLPCPKQATGIRRGPRQRQCRAQGRSKRLLASSKPWTRRSNGRSLLHSPSWAESLAKLASSRLLEELPSLGSVHPAHPCHVRVEGVGASGALRGLHLLFPHHPGASGDQGKQTPAQCELETLRTLPRHPPVCSSNPPI